MERTKLIKRGLGEAERVVKNTVSYLCNTISYVKDKERVNAFNVMYAVMRIVDNLVDEREDRSESNNGKIRKEILKWKKMINKCYEGNPEKYPISFAFFESLSKFKIPKEIWDDFFYSMERDIENPKFRDYADFEKYCLGASCSPTIIYLFLLLSEKNKGVYSLSGFDYLGAGRNLGVWAYLIHILRDVKKDADNSLFYLPEKELNKFDLKIEDIIQFSNLGIGDKRYSSFLQYYLKKAEDYHQSSIGNIEIYLKKISKDRRFSVLIILRTYEELAKRLKLSGEKVFSGEKILSVEDYKKIEKDLLEKLNI